uniref:Uncharacterized protein n=1 Tax=mine drainage metagenome TaxID=410659 RepID=E6PQF2_9ZZZZ
MMSDCSADEQRDKCKLSASADARDRRRSVSGAEEIRMVRSLAHASALRAQVAVVALHEDMTLTKSINPSRRGKHCYDFGLDARLVLWHNFRLPS